MAFAQKLVIPSGGSLPLPRDEQQPFGLGVVAPTPPESLPPGAAARLAQLRQNAADQHALTPSFEERHAASNAKIAAEQRLKRLQDHAQLGGFAQHDNSPSVVTAQKVLAEAASEVQRLDRLYQSRSTQRQSAARTLHDVESWLRNGRPRGTSLTDFDSPAVRLAKGEHSLLDGIANRRRRISELRDELAAVERAPFPSAYCKQRVREQIEELAARGAVNVAGMVQFGNDLKFARAPTEVQIHNVPGGAIGFTEVIDAPALLAWTFRDQLLAKLDAAIDAAADDSNAMFPEERQQRAAEIFESILEIERAECSLLWRALEQNLPVEFRSNCSPLAILECTLVTARG